MDVIDSLIGDAIMKKRIAIAVIFLCSITCTVLAQEYAIDKGSYQIAGMVGFQSMGGDLYGDADDNRLTSLDIAPGLRYFVAPKIALGADLLYTRTSQGDESSTTLGIGPVVILAFGSSQSKTYPYIGGGIFYARNTEKSSYEEFDPWIGQTTTTEEDKISGSDLRFGTGLIQMVSKNLGIMVELSYHIHNMKPEEGDSQSGNMIWFKSGLSGFIF